MGEKWLTYQKFIKYMFEKLFTMITILTLQLSDMEIYNLY